MVSNPSTVVRFASVIFLTTLFLKVSRWLKFVTNFRSQNYIEVHREEKFWFFSAPHNWSASRALIVDTAVTAEKRVRKIISYFSISLSITHTHTYTHTHAHFTWLPTVHVLLKPLQIPNGDHFFRLISFINSAVL